jgi:hypothetical protein
MPAPFRRILTAAWFAAALAGLVAPASAQTTPPEPGPWKFRSVLGATLSQSAFSSNWRGGESGSLAWVATADAAAERQFNSKFNLLNVLQLAYGQTSSQEADDTGELRWDTPDKTSDMIAFESTGRFTLNRYLDPYFALRLDSQFRDESDPIGSIPFNPIRLKETAGIARVLLKTDSTQIITRLGLGFRQAIGKSFIDPVTRAKDSYASTDGGIEWQTNAAGRILEDRVVVIARLLVFQTLFYSNSDDVEQYDVVIGPTVAGYENVQDFWKTTDVDAQLTLSTSITKHLAVNLFAQFVYDKFDTAANVDAALEDALANGYRPANDIERAVRKAGQFKETLGLGITYQLF